MKIYYITNTRLPTEKAHGLATVKICEAFAAMGSDVTLVVPRRINNIVEDTYDYYQVKRNFSIVRLPSLDLLWLGVFDRVFFVIQLFSFIACAVIWLALKRVSGKMGRAVIFSHDHMPLFFASFIAPNIFYDIHHYPERTIFYTDVLKKAIGVAVQTKWKIKRLVDGFGVPQKKVIYWPNGTDIERFGLNISKNDARVKLGLPTDKKIVIYTGQLFKWKGVDTLISSAGFLPPDILLYIVGGEDSDIENSKSKAQNSNFNNIIFVGQKPWQEIPLWLKAADVLVLPNTGKEKVSVYYTSPMKLFEYMASSRPIVASDITSIREVVDESMVFFARPDDSKSFAEVIQRVLSNPVEASIRSERSLKESQKYTWDSRAKKILETMSSVK